MYMLKHRRATQIIDITEIIDNFIGTIFEGNEPDVNKGGLVPVSYAYLHKDF